MLKIRIIKKITALSTAMAIFAVSLTGCGGFDTEDMPDTPEVTEDMAERELPEIAGKKSTGECRMFICRWMI